MEIPTYLYVMRAVINIFLAFLNTGFIRLVLTPKDRFSGAPLFWGTFAVAMGHLLLNMLLYRKQAIKIIFAILFLALGTGIFYRDKFFRRMGVGISFMFLTFLSESIMAGLLAGLYNVSIMDYLDPNNMRLAPVLILIYAVVFGGTYLLLWQRRKWKNIVNMDRFFVLPFSQLVILSAFASNVYIDSQSVDLWDTVITLVVLAFFVVTDIVFLRIVDTFIWQKRREEQQTLEKQHYAAMMEQQSSIRKMRHDIANHLMTIETMVDRGDPGAQEYSRRLMQDVQETQLADWCDNQVVNAVLYSKASEAAAADIGFQADVRLSETVGVDELDLMSLLSNLLDHALTEAARSERKMVSVRIQERAGAIVFQVRNTIVSQTAPDIRKNSKQNKMSRGFGVEILKDICSRYNGTFTTALEEDRFEVSVMLLPVSKDV